MSSSSAVKVTSSIPRPKKRKSRTDEDDEDNTRVGSGSRVGAAAAGQSRSQSQSQRKKVKKMVMKRRKRRAANDDDDDESQLDLDAGLNLAFASMDGQLLSDHLAQQVSRFGTELSPVELADLHVPAGSIRDSSSSGGGGGQQARTLENLPAFLEAFADKEEDLGSAPEEKGAPHTIIVAGAGLRAADLTRAVRKYQKKGNTVAKLFAKHIKLEEAVSFLKNNRTGIAVGTPVRLMDLLDNGALSVAHLRRIVVDASHIDQKKRGVMDMRETAIPLARWLTRPEFKDRYAPDADKHMDLLFY